MTQHEIGVRGCLGRRHHIDAKGSLEPKAVRGGPASEARIGSKVGRHADRARERGGVPGGERRVTRTLGPGNPSSFLLSPLAALLRNLSELQHVVNHT
jgi:hypothetical protein